MIVGVGVSEDRVMEDFLDGSRHIHWQYYLCLDNGFTNPRCALLLLQNNGGAPLTSVHWNYNPPQCDGCLLKFGIGIIKKYIHASR